MIGNLFFPIGDIRGSAEKLIADAVISLRKGSRNRKVRRFLTHNPNLITVQYRFTKGKSCLVPLPLIKAEQLLFSRYQDTQLYLPASQISQGPLHQLRGHPPALKIRMSGNGIKHSALPGLLPLRTVHILDRNHGQHRRNDLIDKIDSNLFRLKTPGKIKINKGILIPKAKLPDSFQSLHIGPKSRPHFFHSCLLIA
ncbi:hypothetical protein DSY1283 [Desulfitobacterium hafniense Y51]|uniref:Uncharacterized protein n=1 Tax=Desulfitobacterium hafniense (strain Y51) TaxID=138119 RepID=Q24Y20_DESHY|nr:hypothetical protein DSY1283 [Desulfitobacterium hafniense Y51]